MDFSRFREIILLFRNKEISRESFITLWSGEQKRQGIEVQNALFGLIQKQQVATLQIPQSLNLARFS